MCVHCPTPRVYIIVTQVFVDTGRRPCKNGLIQKMCVGSFFCTDRQKYITVLLAGHSSFLGEKMLGHPHSNNLKHNHPHHLEIYYSNAEWKLDIKFVDWCQHWTASNICKKRVYTITAVNIIRVFHNIPSVEMDIWYALQLYCHWILSKNNGWHHQSHLDWQNVTFNSI